MDCQDYITESVERKKGQRLQREERRTILPSEFPARMQTPF